MITLYLTINPRKTFTWTNFHLQLSIPLGFFCTATERERDFSKSGLRGAIPQAPGLDRQPRFYHLHKELGEIHLTGLKVNALNATDSNSAMSEGTFSPLNLS